MHCSHQTVDNTTVQETAAVEDKPISPHITLVTQQHDLFKINASSHLTSNHFEAHFYINRSNVECAIKQPPHLRRDVLL